MITTKIQIKEHLAEYCIGKWGTDFRQPVSFPVNTDLYAAIYNLTIKRPENCPLDKGNLVIILPSKRYDPDLDVRKHPEVYNYLSERACGIIQRKIETLFWAELHELIDENKHRLGIEYVDSVYTFMCKYRITKITEDALLKNYQRWKENIRKRQKRNYRKSVKKQ